MTFRSKKLISILLSASLVMTMSSFSFAENGDIEEPAVLYDNDDDEGPEFPEFEVTTATQGTVWAEDGKTDLYSWEITGDSKSGYTLNVEAGERKYVEFDGDLVNGKRRFDERVGDGEPVYQDGAEYSKLRIWDMKKIVIGEGISKVDFDNWMTVYNRFDPEWKEEPEEPDEDAPEEEWKKYDDDLEDWDENKHEMLAETISLPSTLESIGECHNSYYPIIKEVTVKNNNKGGYFTENNALMQKGEDDEGEEFVNILWHFTGKKEKKYSIPQGTTDIGDAVFAYDMVLEEIEIPDSVGWISGGAFEGVRNLKELNIHKARVGTDDQDPADSDRFMNAYREYKEDEEDDEITEEEFKYVYYGIDSFDGCWSLEKVETDPDNEFYTSNDGILYSKDGKTLYYYPEGRDAADHTFTVPGTVKTVFNKSFNNVYKITKLIVPKTVERFNAFSYYDCEGEEEDEEEDEDDAALAAYSEEDDDPEYSLTDVYYEGTEEEWKKITAGPEGSENIFFDSDIKVHYNYKPETGDDEAEKAEQKKAEAISNNEITGRVEGVKLEISELPGVMINYNTEIPYFGKSFKKDDITKIIGDMTISYNNSEYKPKAAKIIKVKGISTASWNASIQITKLEGSGADLKKAQKALKKATKPKSKSEPGLIGIHINPLNLANAVSNNQIDKPVVSGKADKLSIKFTLKTTGKKTSTKNAKKDSFGNPVKISIDGTTKAVTVESGDMKGTMTAEMYESKIK